MKKWYLRAQTLTGTTICFPLSEILEVIPKAKVFPFPFPRKEVRGVSMYFNEALTVLDLDQLNPKISDPPARFEEAEVVPHLVVFRKRGTHLGCCIGSSLSITDQPDALFFETETLGFRDSAA